MKDYKQKESLWFIVAKLRSKGQNKMMRSTKAYLETRIGELENDTSNPYVAMSLGEEIELLQEIETIEYATNGFEQDRFDLIKKVATYLFEYAIEATKNDSCIFEDEMVKLDQLIKGTY